VEVEFPVPAGEDPATWSPAPEVVLGFQEADLILLNGAEYEGWVATATLPSARVVDASVGLGEEIIVVEDGLTHSHGPEGEHSHAVTASEVWLDLGLAARQAATVRDALARAEPESATAFAERFSALEADLHEVGMAFERAAEAARGHTLVAVGVGYTYLSRGYGIELITVPFDPANPGSHDFWHEVEHAVADGAGPVVLWPTEPSAEVRTRLTSMGLEAVLFDPAGARPAQGDFVEVMTANAQRLEGALGGS
jgi:zinc transport system substrate-binding protein